MAFLSVFIARLWRLFDDFGLALILFLRRGRLGLLRGLRRDFLLRLLLDRLGRRRDLFVGLGLLLRLGRVVGRLAVEGLGVGATCSLGCACFRALVASSGASRSSFSLFSARGASKAGFSSSVSFSCGGLGCGFFSGSGGSGGFCSSRGGGCSACCSAGGGGSLTTSTEISSSGVGMGGPILSMKIRKATSVMWISRQATNRNRKRLRLTGTGASSRSSDVTRNKGVVAGEVSDDAITLTPRSCRGLGPPRALGSVRGPSWPWRLQNSRHRERSETIQSQANPPGLLRSARNDVAPFDELFLTANGMN